MAEVEVWPEYPLPSFLELTAEHRALARAEAREFRRRYAEQRSARNLRGQLHLFSARTAIWRREREAAKREAQANAAGHLADGASRIYWRKYVFGERHHLRDLPRAAPAA